MNKTQDCVQVPHPAAHLRTDRFEERWKKS